MENITQFFSAGGLFGLMSMVIVLVSYLIPTFVCMYRNLKQTASIFVLNFFLGWTIIGWVFALMLALWPWRDAPDKKSDALPNLYLPDDEKKA